MSQRSKAVELLSEYFEKKGEILNPVQYKQETDTPIRLGAVKRTFGTWSRMEKIVRAFDARNKNRPEPITNAREVIDQVNREAAEKEALLRSIGEDVDQKVQREAAARAQIETDALNAATPEGARANKIRKGGVESVDAKTIKEAAARLVANEHAMFAKTPEGSALGKELLGGVEDQDEKNLAIARQNARTERSAALAATPEGSALAMVEEDDSDGHLTREAQARIRNELRLYVQPALDENVEEIVNSELEKVRPELKNAIQNIKDKEDGTDAALRGDLAYAESGVPQIITEGDMSKAVPTHQSADESLTEFSEEDQKKAGVKVEPAEKPKAPEATNAVSGAKTSTSAPANKDSVNAEQNKENPEAPPADRNPDPKFAEPAEKKTPPAKK